MDTLTTGYWVIPDEDEPKKSHIHFILDSELTFCTTPISKEGELVFVSKGAKLEYVTCKRCRQKYRKERRNMGG